MIQQWSYGEKDGNYNIALGSCTFLFIYHKLKHSFKKYSSEAISLLKAPHNLLLRVQYDIDMRNEINNRKKVEYQSWKGIFQLESVKDS